jgi:Glyoxalase superfamily protein
MHTHHDAKAMAKILANECATRGLKLTHSESLEIVARQFGLKNWNVLAAVLGGGSNGAATGGRNAADHGLTIPEGWQIGGTAPHLYAMGVPGAGGPVTLIRTVGSPPDQGNIYGTLMQVVSPEAFREKSVRFSADVKTEDVEGSAAVWLRIDDATGRVLAFSDLQRGRFGALRGTADWTPQSIALAVPADAHSIHFGVYLHGFGRAFARNLALAAADAPDLGLNDLPAEPTNLDLKADKAA